MLKRRLYISILEEGRIRMRNSRCQDQGSFEGIRCDVIEIRFNYFLLGGETQGQYSDRGGDEVPTCLGVTLNLWPRSLVGSLQSDRTCWDNSRRGATMIIYELQLPSTPAPPESRNKVTKEGGGSHCPHLVWLDRDHRLNRSFSPRSS